MNILPTLWGKAKQRWRALHYPAVLRAKRRPSRGRVLISYLAEPLWHTENSPYFDYHSNRWESLQIASIFSALGYDVDVIDYNDKRFIPRRQYQVVFDIYTNLARFTPLLGAGTIKLLHATGSDPVYQNAAEQARVDAVNQRRASHCVPRRQVDDPHTSRLALEHADFCSLIGNEHTLNTYPPHIRAKMTCVTVSTTRFGKSRTPQEFVPKDREFLWYFGTGAIHKGLDLLLEVFAEAQEFTLNIVGTIDHETDFLQTYDMHLRHSPNIRYYGALRTDSDEFRAIMRRVFCLAAPSCSEGISPAVATMLQLGVYPIISRDTGITLPEGLGIYLESCSIEEIRSALHEAYDMPEDQLRRDIGAIQAYAQEAYSRERFRSMMSSFIQKAIAEDNQE